MMKVGDLVRPVPPNEQHLHYTSAPIVEQEWLGIIIDFTGDYYSSQGEMIAKGSHPIVYWNPEFQAEVEYPDQIEVVPCKNGS